MITLKNDFLYCTRILKSCVLYLQQVNVHLRMFIYTFALKLPTDKYSREVLKESPSLSDIATCSSKIRAKYIAIWMVLRWRSTVPLLIPIYIPLLLCTFFVEGDDFLRYFPLPPCIRFSVWSIYFCLQPCLVFSGIIS